MKNKIKVLSCSTPEHRADSPSKDSESLYDSDTASPVPFLCTQDGTEGETDVVWNFYSPKSDNSAVTQPKNTTPLSRKGRKLQKPKQIDQPLPKRRPFRASQKTTQLFQELVELNQNLSELIAKKIQNKHLTDKQQLGSDDDIFSESSEPSPKNILRTSSHCLRKNLLNSKFAKPEPGTALESDDSMNECLLAASQAVEDTITKYEPVPAKKTCYEVNNKTKKDLKQSLNFKIDHDSMDSILNSIKLESPTLNKAKKCDSPCLNNDSFDSLIGNLNDSVLEQLTQVPMNKVTPHRKTKPAKDASWTIKELIVHDGSPSSNSIFGRYNSMPESPTIIDNKPSTSGMAFGRYNSMPYGKDSHKNTGDTPIRCTPDEIKRKHQQAREKLLAKRLLPFTSTQQNNQPTLPIQKNVPPKKTQFQPRVASSNITKITNNNQPAISEKQIQSTSDNSVDLKTLIERKKQMALMKLRRKQLQNKTS